MSKIVINFRFNIDRLAIGAGGLGFDSRADQIDHSVAIGQPSLRRFFETVLPRR